MTEPRADPLLSDLAAGRQQAFEALYDRFAGRLYRAAVRMLGDHQDAEDTVQEVFLAVVRSRARLSAVRDLTAYLFASLRRAAGRCAARRARRPGASPAADRAAAGVPQQAPGGSYADRLGLALAALPAAQREVIAMKIEGELTFRQIAAVTGVSINTAASRYRYALESLRAAMED